MSASDDIAPDDDPAPRRRWPLLAFIPLAVFAVLAALLLLRLFAGDASLLPSALIGKPVPSFDLAAVAGTDKPGLAAADLRGGDVSVLNVFASWCVPCREEAPALGALQRQGVRLVGIAYKDRPEATRRFLNTVGDPYQRIGADVDGRIGIDFGVYGVPETYVVDGDGTIAAKIVGPLTDAVIKDQLMPALAKAKTAISPKPPA